MRIFIFFFFVLFFLPDSSAQSLHIPLSPMQETKVTLGKTEIKLTYSRPSMRGRLIFGGLEPFGKKWRTGANRNSKIEFSHPVMIGDQKIKKGSYAIITTPGKSDWDVYFYSDVSHWEVPEPWIDSLVAAKITVPAIHLANPVQSLEFSFDDLKYDSCNLSLAWENTMINIPIKLFTEEQMLKAIDKTLSGPTSSNYTSAAVYRLQTGQDLGQAIEWVDIAISMRDEPSFYDYLIKARILANQANNAEAKIYYQKSLGVALESGREYWIEMVKMYSDIMKD